MFYSWGEKRGTINKFNFWFSYHKGKRTDFLKEKEKNGLVFGRNVASSIHNDNEVLRNIDSIHLRTYPLMLYYFLCFLFLSDSEKWY